MVLRRQEESASSESFEEIELARRIDEFGESYFDKRAIRSALDSCNNPEPVIPVLGDLLGEIGFDSSVGDGCCCMRRFAVVYRLPTFPKEGDLSPRVFGESNTDQRGETKVEEAGDDVDEEGGEGAGEGEESRLGAGEGESRLGTREGESRLGGEIGESRFKFKRAEKLNKSKWSGGAREDFLGGGGVGVS
jgi:hypothetical protein